MLDLSKLQYCTKCNQSIYAPICSVRHQVRYIEAINEIRRREGLPPKRLEVPDWLPT